jgi:hypothetical protein
MTEREEILKRMKKIGGCFQQHSLDNDLFQPEFLCAKTIREKVETLGHLTTRDAEDILKIINKTNTGQHYNGSGWSDYQLHLKKLFTVDDLKVDIDNFSGWMSINAD